MASPLDRARTILELIDLIEEHVRDVGEDAFVADVHMRDATGLRLIAIGEAARAIDVETQQRFPKITWPKIVAMRNFIAHNYEGISGAILWETVRVHLPALGNACRAILAQGGEQP